MADPYCTSLHLNCDRAHAFDVFTSKVDIWWPPSHRRLKGSRLRFDPRPGGRFYEVDSVGQEAVLGEVLIYAPPDHLQFTWHMGKITEPSRVDIRFSTEGAKTLVSLEHSEGAANMGPIWPEKVALFERGWTHVFAAFSAFIDETEKG